MEQELLQLEGRINRIVEWTRSRSRESLKYPLDFNTIRVLRNCKTSPIFVPTGKILTGIPLVFNDPISTSVVFKYNSIQRACPSLVPIKNFTVNPITNIFTNSSGASNLNNGDIIFFGTTDTLPSPLTPSTPYYVINSSGNTFKVSTTLGGLEVDITSSGSGDHYWVRDFYKNI